MTLLTGTAIRQIETAASLTAPMGQRSVGARITRLRESGSGVLDVLTGEGERFMAQRLCPNMNHRRRDSPVAFCPDCGEVVNPGIPPRSCSEESHAKQRRERSHYCVDCGEQLIRER
jgi:rRNA maturation protein Nop10